jgi:hypothetical protein
MVAGGWAIDLFLGRVTREHVDVDLAVWRDQQERLREALPGWTFCVADAGVLRPWPEREWLALPLHEIHATLAGEHLEFLINDRVDHSWTYRRDPAIRRLLSRAIRQRGEIRFLAPEIVFLYKATAPRASDECDLRAAANLLGPEPSHWLCQAIASSSPDHPWLDHLSRPDA